MSECNLGDDVRAWPDDCFQILGVDRSVNEKDLKRAYTRLIRRFKPEHFPEHFRKLREAYEACLSNVQFYFLDFESSVLNRPEARANLEGSEKDRASSEFPIDLRPAPKNPVSSPPKAVDEEVIELVTAGENQMALDRLRQENRRGNSDSLLVELEYWLGKLTLPSRTGNYPAEVLLSAFNKGVSEYSLLGCLELEALKSPAILLDLKLERVLKHSASSVVSGFIDLRWKSAHRTDRFEVIINDCQMLNEFYFDEISKWLQFSKQATEHLVWSRDLSHVQTAMGMAEDLNRDSESLPKYMRDLTDLDILLRTTKALFDYQSNPKSDRSLWKLFAHCWNWIGPEWREGMLRWMIDLQENLADRIVVLDELVQCDPVLLHFLRGRALNIQRDSWINTGDSVESQSVLSPKNSEWIRSFLASQKTNRYRAMRVKLLEFCIDKSINPSQVVLSLQNEDSPVRHAFSAGFRNELKEDIVFNSVFQIIDHLNVLTA